MGHGFGVGRLFAFLVTLIFLTKKGLVGTSLYRKLRLAHLVVIIAMRVATRRVVFGPKLPSWSFKAELLTEMMRDSLSVGQHKLDVDKFPKARKAVERFRPLLSRSAKHFHITIPGSEVSAEWIVPIPDQSEANIPEISESHHSIPALVRHSITQIPVLLYLHGGGYVSMSVATHRAWIGKIVVSSNCIALAINYRLGKTLICTDLLTVTAPENPFPAGLLDALWSFRWLVSPESSGGLAIPPERITIAGDSAGGGLALATCLSLIHGSENPIYSPFTYLKEGEGDKFMPKHFKLDLPLPALLVLVSPWTDLECKGSSWKTNAEYCYLVPEPIVCEWYAGHHLTSNSTLKGREKLELSHPLLSPANADFRNFPRVLIQVGEKETLLDDSLLISRRMRECGVDVNLETYPDMVHVFQMFGKIASETSTALASIAKTIIGCTSNVHDDRHQIANISLAKL